MMMSNDELVFLLSMNIFNLKQIKEIYTVLYDEISNNEMSNDEISNDEISNNKISNDKYACFHIKTIPHKDIIFASGNNNPKYWTFCFIHAKQFPKSLFMFFSDHDDGVFNQLYKPNNKYIIDSNTLCIWGQNNIPINQRYTCSFRCDDVEYDWFNNLIIQDPQCKKNINKSQERKPSETYDTFWLFEKGNTSHTNNVGKWMLFYRNDDLDDKWELIKQLFRSDKLSGVISMKCSTAKENPRSSDNSSGVIILYCNNSDDEKKIMEIGQRIVNEMKYCEYDQNFLYYKTDLQTSLGTRATGQKKNWLYRLSVTKKEKFVFRDDNSNDDF